jgi:hypothetical protein
MSNRYAQFLHVMPFASQMPLRVLKDIAKIAYHQSTVGKKGRLYRVHKLTCSKHGCFGLLPGASVCAISVPCTSLRTYSIFWAIKTRGDPKFVEKGRSIFPTEIMLYSQFECFERCSFPSSLDEVKILLGSAPENKIRHQASHGTIGHSRIHAPDYSEGRPESHVLSM